MQLLRDKRASIWTEIVDLISLKQLQQCMGDEARTWVARATKVKCVSKSKRVHQLADQLIAEVNRIAITFTWFQGLPYERTQLVKSLIHGHIVAVQECDHETTAEIEEYLFELQMAPTREELYSGSGK